ncbi:MAG: hypothetical protein HUJ77_08805 [Clostridium sp.]|uniref:hypothetical protein n=1 Tax=Clostridium sp. TaxID=1506 RepID=UPI0025C13AB3|nr:hypothetical protein [Clostridium sp.]MCF0148483.1 hypothetical protein [Clostridium sp.]
MSKVINLEEFKNKERKEIEEIACYQYGVIKINDDLYLFPDASFTTGSLDLSVFLASNLNMNIEQLLEGKVIDIINKVVDLPNQNVDIFLAKKNVDDTNTFEIVNVSNNKGFFLSTDITNDSESRKIFTAIIAGAIKKINVRVTYMLDFSYEQLKEIIYK